jgi:Helix-turn-helix of DDE superfamily endonuclease
MPRYEDLLQRAGSLRAMTGLTEQECTALLPHFEHACAAYMHDHTIDGQPRTSRRYRTYDTCPLPTMADKLLFMLTYVKQHPIQEVQGQLFGRSQSNANTWMHLLQTVLNLALAHQDLLPARTADECATLLATTRTKDGATRPLFGMMVRSDRSTAQPTPRTSKRMTVARRKATRSKTSSCSMRPVTCASCVRPMQAKRMIKAWRTWRVTPCPRGVVSIKIWASRDSSWPASPSSNPRKSLVGVNSLRLSKRPIVGSRPSASAWNMPLAG